MRAQPPCSRWIAVTVALAFHSSPGAVAHAGDETGPTYRRHRGQIVFQGEEFPAVDDEKSLAELVKKAKRNKALEKDKDGNWRFNFIAFLSSAPGANKVNLVWFSLGKKTEQIDYTEFSVPPSEVILRAKSVLIGAQGFASGGKYEARITRVIGGKEKVYARCRLSLQ
ncbi:MAG: hypothetical protein IT371_14000 [Deltaproteobacteria bacterium]|nr:hypothetical protein [Deltaproteobacteria bacterium]